MLSCDRNVLFPCTHMYHLVSTHPHTYLPPSTRPFPLVLAKGIAAIPSKNGDIRQAIRTIEKGNILNTLEGTLNIAVESFS